MSFSLELYKNLNWKTKYLICGYIRKAQLSLSINVSYNIPISINYICAIYYFGCDEWDESSKNSEFIINGNIVTKTGGGFVTIFLKNITYDYGKYDWKFKLNADLTYDGGCLTYAMQIGIVKNHKINKSMLNTYIGKYANTSYLFACEYGVINDHKKGDEWMPTEKYLEHCKRGDILHMMMDLDQLQLRFAINDGKPGKIIKIDKCKYRAAASWVYKRESIQLLSQK